MFSSKYYVYIAHLVLRCSLNIRLKQKLTMSKESERLVLSNSDRDLFMSVMENPPELKGKLKSAIHKYRQKYGK